MIYLHKSTTRILPIPENTDKIGILNRDIINPLVTEELNGIFKFEFELPNTSIYLPNIKSENLVSCNISTYMNRQFFRIKHIVEDEEYTRVTAYHVFYDLADTMIMNTVIENGSGTYLLDRMLAYAKPTHPFRGMSDISATTSMEMVRVNPVQALLGSGEDSFVSKLGGEIYRDNYYITMQRARGKDRGLVVTYAKNLLGYEANVDYSTVVTRLVPVGNNDIMLPEEYVDSDNINKYHNVKVREIKFDHIKAFDEEKSLDKQDEDAVSLEQAYELMRTEAKKQFTDGKIDVPHANYRVNFVDLATTEEYKHLSVLKKAYLGDTVTVDHIKNDLKVKAKVISYTYNPLSKSMETLELGNYGNSFVSVQSKLEDLRKEIEDSGKSLLEQARDKATELITSGFGGYVKVYPDRILVMDTDDINTSMSVWQFNKNGLGHSKTGINGPYELAMTSDGSIVADMITTGTLNASVVRTGTLKGGKVSFDLDAGTFLIGTDTENYELYYDGQNLKMNLKEGVSSSEFKIGIDGLYHAMTGEQTSVVVENPDGTFTIDTEKFKSIVPEAIEKAKLDGTARTFVEIAKADKVNMDKLYTHILGHADLKATQVTQLRQLKVEYDDKYNVVVEGWDRTDEGREPYKIAYNSFIDTSVRLGDLLRELKDYITSTDYISKVDNKYDDMVNYYNRDVYKKTASERLMTILADETRLKAEYDMLMSSEHLIGPPQITLYDAYRGTGGYNMEYLAYKAYLTSLAEGTIERDETVDTSKTTDYLNAMKAFVDALGVARKMVEDKRYTEIATEFSSAIQATERELTSKYDARTVRRDPETGKEITIQEDVSSIQQTANGLVTEVRKKVGINEVISMINQSAEEITISASKINLSGYVTTSKLSTDGYVTRDHLTTTDNTRAGVNPYNVNAGKLDANTVKTSSSTRNYVELENQYVRFYNGSLLKMYLGFSEWDNYPVIALGAGGTGTSWSGDRGVIRKTSSRNCYYGYMASTTSSITPTVDTGMVAGEMLRFFSKGNAVWFDDTYINHKKSGSMISNFAPSGTPYSNQFALTIDGSGTTSGFYIDGTGHVDIVARSVYRHRFYADGTKSGGSIEIDGENYGMSPVDSPKILLEDLYIDIEATPEGTRVNLDDRFKKTITFPYAVFCSNGAECIEKDRNYFVVKGRGKVDITVKGTRIGHDDVYYKPLEQLPKTEKREYMEQLSESETGIIEVTQEELDNMNAEFFDN